MSTSSDESSLLQVGSLQHSETQRQAALRALWNGQDLPEEVMSNFMQDLPTSLTLTDSNQTSSSVGYVLLGSFDSGTNLFEVTAGLNFPSVSILKPVWKHSTLGAEAIAQAIKERSTTKPKDIVLVILVRSPIAQIVSWKKESYNLRGCGDRTYSSMDKPCIGYTDMISEGGCLQYSRHCNPHEFTSTMDAYNTYLAQYQDLKKHDTFKKVLMLGYEDLVLDADKVMKEFGEACDTRIPKEIQLQEDPAKDHGDPCGRSEAEAKIKSRSWLEELQQSEVKLFCKDLKRSLIEDRFEGSYRKREQQVPYTKDCD